MFEKLTRRMFFRRGASAPVAGLLKEADRPQKAWIIVELGWEYNDEFTYQEGEYPLPKVYFDRQEADRECARRCREFFAAQTPEEFEVDFDQYRPDLPPGATPQSVTWEQLREAGFKQPYIVQEMEA